MKWIINLMNKIKCSVGIHDWEQVGDDSHVFEALKDPEVQMVCYSSLHKCTRCSKEELKGMVCKLRSYP